MLANAGSVIDFDEQPITNSKRFFFIDQLAQYTISLYKDKPAYEQFANVAKAAVILIPSLRSNISDSGIVCNLANLFFWKISSSFLS